MLHVTFLTLQMRQALERWSRLSRGSRRFIPRRQDSSRDNLGFHHTSKKTNKLDPLLGIFDLEHKIKALPAAHCDPNDSAKLFVIEKCVA
jgi:hypothetical protein